VIDLDAVFAESETPLVEQSSFDHIHEIQFRRNPGSRLNLFLGVEATWLRPFQRGNGPSTSASGVFGTSTINGDSVNGFYGAPRIWLGAGIGDSPYFVQVRYWDFSGTTTSTYQDTSFGAFGNSIGSLAMSAFDFEVGRAFRIETLDANGMFTFGGRYANWNQSSQTMLNEGIFSSSTAFGKSNFDGTGLTFGLQLNKQLGESGWSVFGGSHFSFIWGQQSGSATTTVVVLGPIFPQNDSFNGNDSMLYVAEVQLGTQWQRRLAALNSDFFFRIALEYQYWNLDSTKVATAFMPGGVGLPAANANSGQMQMGLFGLAVGTGLTW
jgi:hypothetical protein